MKCKYCSSPDAYKTVEERREYVTCPVYRMKGLLKEYNRKLSTGNN